MMVPSTHEKTPLLIICGPTAVGKTALAIELAAEMQIEVVSADSRQIYRMMDVGTAKPTESEQAAVKHHLIDVAWPDEDFNAARYIELAGAAIEDIRSRDLQPVLVGGTGLYIRALTEGLLDAPGADPVIRKRLHAIADEQGCDVLHRQLMAVDRESAKRLHPNDLVRIVRALEVYEQCGKTMSELQREHGFREQPYRVLKLGLSMEREALFERINARSEEMFVAGLVEETERLLAAGYDSKLKTLQTIGYRQAVAYIQGDMSKEEAIADLQVATRRYAKQQITWFKQDNSIIWVDSCSDSDKIRKLIDNF